MKKNSNVFNHRYLLSLYGKSKHAKDAIVKKQIAEGLCYVENNILQSGCSNSIAALNRYFKLMGIKTDIKNLREHSSDRNYLPQMGAEGHPGISVVTCAMNRTENLLRALPSWLSFNQVMEVVIVDWSSQASVKEALESAGLTDERIKVVRVDGEPRWILSYAFNVGFRASTCSTIMKLDADIILNQNYFDCNELPRPNTFIAGNHRIAKKGQEHINGFLVATREALAKVGGYNEYITRYGWDDDDLYGRLENIDLKRIDVNPDSLYHIPHSDAKRTGVLDDGNAATIGESIATSTRFLIHFNRNLCEMLPAWNGDMPQVPMKLESQYGSSISLSRLLYLHLEIPEGVMEKAAKKTYREILSWDFGGKVWSISEKALNVLLGRKTDKLTPVDIELALKNESKLPQEGRYLLLVPDQDLTEVADSNDCSEMHKALTLLMQLAKRKGLNCLVCTPSGTLPQTAPSVLSTLSCLSDKVLNGMKKVSLSDLGSASIRGDAWIPISMTTLSHLSMSMPLFHLPRRKFYVDAQHGLGNRLRAIGSAAAIANANDMELVIVWEPDHHCDCRLSELFDYNGPVIEKGFVSEAPDQGLTVHNYMSTEEGGKKDMPVHLDGSCDLYGRSAFVFKSPHSSWVEENRFLQTLVPVDAVQGLVASVRHPNDVSAHVRMEAGPGLDHNSYDRPDNWQPEDHALIHEWRTRSHFSHFMKRLDLLAAEGRAQTIFLAADLPQTYLEFADRFGEKLAWLPRRLYDRSAEQLHYALADAILLGRAKLMLGSNWSSFSELAMRLAPGSIKVEMSGIDF